MQMAVDANEEEMFHTESSDESGSTSENSSSDDTSDSDSEEGQLTSDAQKESLSSRQCNQAIQEIDDEMQKRIIELHDKMEESGFDGAVNLIEKLFDNRPGEDKKEKRGIKDKCKKRIADRQRGMVNCNANQNSSIN